MAEVIRVKYGDGDVIEATTLFDINESLEYEQAAKFLKISVRALRKLVSAKQIPHYRIGKSPRFRVSSLIRWIDRREIA